MEEQNKNTYEEKKARREEQKKTESSKYRNKNGIRKLLKATLITAIIISLGYIVFLLSETQAPGGDDFSIGYEIQRGSHVPVGTTEGFEYSSNPPSSGPHYAATIPVGFYDVDELVDDGNVIHDLEHGSVWIAYSPGIPEDVREQLKEFDGGKVIITSREANEFDISLVGWGRVDSFNLSEDVPLDTERISDFIKRYRNKGPEGTIPATHR